MMLFESGLYYLVDDDRHSPLMAPSGMFAQGALQLPPHWEFSIRREPFEVHAGFADEATVALWGYPEFVNDVDHYRRLTEWDSDALNVFAAQLRLA